VTPTDGYAHVELESIALEELIKSLQIARGIDSTRGYTFYVTVKVGDRSIELWRRDVQRFVDEKMGWS
jgi:hypothetical protein